MPQKNNKRNTVRLSEFQYLLGPSSKWIDFIIVFLGIPRSEGQISHGFFWATLGLRMADIQWTEKLCPKVKHLNHAKKPRILCKTDMEFALKKTASFEMRTQTFAVVKKCLCDPFSALCYGMCVPRPFLASGCALEPYVFWVDQPGLAKLESWANFRPVQSWKAQPIHPAESASRW